MDKKRIFEEAYKQSDIAKRFANAKWTTTMTEWKQNKDYLQQKYWNYTILLYRMGEFYETYFYDAYISSKVLDITLTSKSWKDENSATMAWIPAVSIDSKIKKYIENWWTVGVCDQVWIAGTEDFWRKITWIYTPWTYFDWINTAENNYVMGFYQIWEAIWISFLDIWTNSFKTLSIHENQVNSVKNIILSSYPKEILCNIKALDNKDFTNLISEFSLPEPILYDSGDIPYNFLLKHFWISDLTKFGIEDKTTSIISSANILSYAKEAYQCELEYIDKLNYIELKDYLFLDDITLKNLEIFKNATGWETNTLFETINETVTPFWARFLKKVLSQPLKKKDKIDNKLNAVEELFQNENLLYDIIDELVKFTDIERLSSKMWTIRCNAQDLLNLKNSIENITNIKNLLLKSKTPFLKWIWLKLLELPLFIKLINDSIKENPSMKVNEWNIIRKGYNDDLDTYIELLENNDEFLKTKELELRNQTQLQSLKISKSNMWLFIEIKRSDVDESKIPTDWQRERSLKNSDRYVTKELKDLFNKSLTAEFERQTLEYNIFQDIRLKWAEFISKIQENAILLANLDVLCNFAKIAKLRNYVKPIIINDKNIRIEEGRHPVIENICKFIPNDLVLNEKIKINLISWINSWWKSTYIRQNALIVLLAQIWSFVPASYAEIWIVDRIFTRVGSQDNISKKQSTFVNELNELWIILNNATEDSLIILDELWSSTSFEDGYSLAQSILEYFNNLNVKVLFSTHYHELTEFAEKQLPSVLNKCVDIKFDENSFEITHKIKEWKAWKSYWIEIAERLGINKTIIKRAKEIRENVIDLSKEVTRKFQNLK